MCGEALYRRVVIGPHPESLPVLAEEDVNSRFPPFVYELCDVIRYRFGNELTINHDLHKQRSLPSPRIWLPWRSDLLAPIPIT